eukprot:TRINITY_DN4602_c0_g1_i2.p1 TRINITY_DN4602_c0_g1~~TRINITY_DN4602_c0_g1_i2.p1  ORF type:complete len:628 (-),score=179.51 TRINITY_DN4602_c0_g1_i2:103-1986(-)
MPSKNDYSKNQFNQNKIIKKKKQFTNKKDNEVDINDKLIEKSQNKDEEEKKFSRSKTKYLLKMQKIEGKSTSKIEKDSENESENESHSESESENENENMNENKNENKNENENILKDEKKNQNQTKRKIFETIELAKNKDFMDFFWHLISSDPVTRATAANGLIEFLLEIKKNDSSQKNELEYSIKRCIKGLASNSDDARQGFGLALTEILNKFEQVNLIDLLDLIKLNLIPKASDKIQEKNSMNIGRLFSIYAILRSGRLDENKIDKNLKKQIIQSIFDDLIKLSEINTDISQLVFKAQILLFSKVNKVMFQQILSSKIDKILLIEPSKFTPEKILLSIAVLKCFGYNIIEKAPNAWPKCKVNISFINEKTVELLIDCLKSISKTQIVHPLWQVIFDTCYPDSLEQNSELANNSWNNTLQVFFKLEDILFTIDTTKKSKIFQFGIVINILINLYNRVDYEKSEKLISQKIESIILNAVVKKNITLYRKLLDATIKGPLKSYNFFLKIFECALKKSSKHQIKFRQNIFNNILNSKEISYVSNFYKYLFEKFYSYPENFDASNKRHVNQLQTNRLFIFNLIDDINKTDIIKQEQSQNRNFIKFCFYNSFFSYDQDIQQQNQQNQQNQIN